MTVILSAGFLLWYRVFRPLWQTVNRLQAESVTDPLTGVANRRWLDTAGPRVWQQASVVSVIAIDFDRFKEVNDRYGHAGGDAILRSVSDAIRAELRAPDVLARIGGDEFVVLLPETDGHAAAALGRRIADRVAGAPHGPDQVYISISLGVACSRMTNWNSFQSLVEGADHAVYRAKFRGGNRVERWQPDLSLLDGLPGWDAEAAEGLWHLSNPLQQIFHETVPRLLVADDVDSAARELLRACADAGRSTYGALFRYHAETQELRYAVGVGVSAPLDQTLRMKPPWRFGDPKGITGWVAETGEPYYLPDVQSDPRWTGKTAPVRSAFWVPLRIGNELYGVFNVLSDRVDGIAPQARAFIVVISRYASLVFERQRRQQELELALHRERLLATISKEIQAQTEPDAIIQAGLAHALETSAMDAACFLETDASGTSRLVHVLGDCPEPFRKLMAREGIPGGQGAVGRTVAMGVPLVQENYATAAFALPEYVEMGLHSQVIIPLLDGSRVIGVFVVASFGRRVALSPVVVEWLQGLAMRVANAYAHVAVLQEVRRNREEALAIVGQMLELRDVETRGHTERVARLALEMAQRISSAPAFHQAVYWGALLHDVGKIALPDAVLLKDGPLGAQERRQVERHPTVGAEMLAHMSFLPEVTRQIVLYHHERWDGQGYPRGLRGRDIPLAARLFAVIDVYDALTSERRYKRPWAPIEAQQYLLYHAGSQFDPEMVALFLAVLGAGATVTAGPVLPQAEQRAKPKGLRTSQPSDPGSPPPRLCGQPLSRATGALARAVPP